MLNMYWIQRDLNGLGYDCGEADGIYGSRTKNATINFQRDFGLAVDGIPGENTSSKLMYIVRKCQEILGAAVDGYWGDETEEKYQNFNNIKYFKREEFYCKCGCGNGRIDIRLVKILDDIREHYGAPITITSGVRCPSHNKAVGGVSNSWHLSTHNKASDFIVSGQGSGEVNRYCQVLISQGLARYAYAIDGSAVHLDIGGIM